MSEPAIRLGPDAVASTAALRRAILLALIYADIFENPLTRSELHRYLIGRAATTAAVTAALDDDPVLRSDVRSTDELVYLAGRDHLVDVRHARNTASAHLWQQAKRYGALIERLPFVRLVAVTGALAVNNARAEDDIDLFILAQPGRLWTCRLVVLAIVKLAARQGTELCPNFLLSTDHLQLTAHNLYVAHEVAQLVPLSRGPWYDAFLGANAWVAGMLPNALPSTRHVEATARAPWVGRMGGRILSAPLFDPLEQWEMNRKVRRLSARRAREGGDTAFAPHVCRGHFAAHDARVLNAYRTRCAGYREALDGLV
jgi:hypothetical protein